MTDPTSKSVTLRVPDKLLRQIDAHVRRLQRATPGVTFTRTTAILNLCAERLGEIERTERVSS